MSRRAGYLYVAPALLVLLGVAGYPVVAAVWLSLQRAIVIFDERSFVGLDNYAFLLRDARFWSALGHTGYFTALATALELGLGLVLALLLDRTLERRERASLRHGRGLLRATLLVPWAIPTVVAAQLWAWLFNADHGLVVRLLPGPPLNWLGTPGLALHAAVIVDVWKTTPFVALLLLAGLAGIPRELYEAAALDGASRVRVFFRIQLPLLAPTLVVALVLRALDAFRVFDAVYVLTGGGPGNSSETLSIYGYKMLLRAGDFGYGSTIAIATLLCTLALCGLLLGVFGRRGALS